LVVIPAGTFMMGSLAEEPGRTGDEGPQRRVSVGSFALGKTEVTQGQWKAVMGNNPSYFQQCGDDCPVESVSWDDVQEYLKRLNQQTGRNYRLPSEAEWEYAARAGTTTAFHTGRTITTDQSNFFWRPSLIGGLKGELREKTLRVGSFPPNVFGLYDMHGNVWELVQDVWHENYLGAPTDGSPWVSGGNQARRVRRGGSWGNEPQDLRSAGRDWDSPSSSNYDIGFRIARTL